MIPPLDQLIKNIYNISTYNNFQPSEVKSLTVYEYNYYVKFTVEKLENDSKKEQGEQGLMKTFLGVLGLKKSK